MKQKKNKRSAAIIEALEPRVLFSADVLGGVIDSPTTEDPLANLLDDAVTVLERQSAHTQNEQNDSSDSQPLPEDQAEGVIAPLSAEPVSKELVLIDSNTPDYQQLLDDLLAQAEDSRQLDVLLLDANREGISQISDILVDYTNLDAVHLISHASDGIVSLGSSSLDLETLQNNSAEIKDWDNAFAEQGDLLIYGCDMASTSEGERLVDTLAKLTSADVAASDDVTGSANLGGDWDLEYQKGQLETSAVFSHDTQQDWEHLLDVTAVASTTGASHGEDILISHTTSGSDRLMLVGVTLNHAGASDSVSSITYNSDSLNLIGIKKNGDARVEIWALVAPDIGTYVVDVKFSSNSDGAAVGVTTFTGVDQATPLGAFASSSGSSGSASATIASAADEMVFGVIAVDDPSDYDLIEDALQTENWQAYGYEINGGGGTKAGAASVNMSWTWSASDAWSIGGVSIKAEAADVAAPSEVNNTGSTVLEGNSDIITNLELRYDDVVEPAANVSYTVTTSPSYGRLEFNSAPDVPITSFTQDDLDNNRVVYVHNSSETTTDSFSFDVDDGVGNSLADQGFTITISPENDTPTIESTIAGQSLSEDFPSYTIDLNAAFSDAETADNALVYGVNGNSNINVSISSGIATITCTADWNGSETLTFTATDGGTPGLSASQDVVFAVSAEVDIANDVAVSVVEDTATAIAVLANDTFEGTPVVTAISSPSHGGVVVNGDNTITYTPTANYTGTDSFTYTVTSGDVTETATVTINVTSVNDAPVVTVPAVVLAATEQVGLSIEGTGFSVSDVDEEGAGATATLSVSEGRITVAEGDSGVTIDAGNNSNAVKISGAIAQINNLLTGAGTGTITYRNTSDAPSTSTTFTVTVNDQGNTGADPSATGDGSSEEETNSQTINITATNDAAVITGTDTGSVQEDVAVVADNISTSGTLNIVDPDTGESSFQTGTINGSYGDLVMQTNGNWSYTADNTQAAIQQLDLGESLTDTLTVSAFDSTTHNVIITINGSDDAAVISGTTTGTVQEDGTLTSSAALAITDTDSSDPTDFVDVASTAGDNGYGSFAMTGNTWTYSLDNANASVQALDVGETLIDTFTFSAPDGVTQQVSVTINGAEDASVITATSSGTVTEDTILTASGTLAISDVDSSDNPVSFADVASIPGDNGYGDFVLSGGTWTYTLDIDHTSVQALDVGQTLNDRHTFVATDGSSLMVAITISGAEDLPTVENAIADQAAVEDSPFSFTFASNVFDDVDTPDTLSYTASLVDDSALPTWLSFDAVTRTFSGTPANADVGSLNVKAIASDGDGTVSDTFSLIVNNTSDAPLVGGDSSAALTEDLNPDADNLLEASGTLTIADPDAGESSFVEGTIGGTYGNLVIDSAGNWSYSASNTQAVIQQLDVGESINDVLTVTTADGTPQTVTITINGAEDAPEITAIISATLAEDGSQTASGTLTISDTDTSDNPVSFADVTSIPGDNGYGDFVLTGGTWVYTLDNNLSAVQALDAGETLTDTHTYTATDSSTRTVTITIDGAEDSAIITGTITGTVAEDANLTASGTLAISDTDTSDNPVSFDDQSSTPGDNSYGNFTMTGSSWIYTLNSSHAAVQGLDAGEILTDSFSFVSSGGAVQLVTITINGTEDAPTLQNSIADQTAAEDSPFDFTFASDVFADVDTSDTLSYTASLADDSALPTWLSFDALSRTFNGTPTNADLGILNVKVTANDGSSTVSATFSLTINNTSDAPVIGGDSSATLTEDLDPDTDNLLETSGTLTIADPDAGESSFLAGTIGGTYGNLVIDTAGNWSYAADNTQSQIQQLDVGESIYDVLTITTADGTPQTITITINGAEDAPEITAITSGTVAEDGSLTASGTLAISDTDTSDNPVSFADEVSIPGDNGYGDFVLTDGTWVYTLDNNLTAVQALDAGETLTDTHTYTATDSSTRTVTITINGAGDSAIITGTTTGTLSEDSLTSANGTLAVSDLDTSDSSVSFIDEAPVPGNNGFGDFAMTGGNWSYTLNSTHPSVQALDVGETLSDSHIFYTSGGDSQLVTITITGAEDAPTVDNAIPNKATQQDASFNFTFAANAFVDVDAADTLLFSATQADGSPLPAWLNFDAATRTFSGTPTSADLGTLSYKVTADDGSSTVSDTFNITVLNSSGGTPAITGNFTGAVSEDVDPDLDDLLETSGALSITDPDSAESGFLAGTISGTYGNLTIDNAGNWNYAADNTQVAIQQLDVGQSINDVLRVTTLDGTARNITITINGAEDAAEITAITSGSVAEDGSLIASGTLTISDIDILDNPVSFTDVPSIPGDNGYGDFVLAGGTWGYTLDNNLTAVQALDTGETLIDTHTFSASDGNTRTVTITINGSEDAAIITATTTGSVTEDNTLSASGTLAISDIDTLDNPVSFTDQPSTLGDNGYGDFALNAGSWTYNLNTSHPSVQALDAGQTLSDTHTFTASDGNSRVVTIIINGTEDLPYVENVIANQTAVEDIAFSFTFASNVFDDIDASDTLSYSASLADDSPLPGWLSFNSATRTFSGTPLNADVGSLSVKVTADDGAGTVSDIFTLTIYNTDDAPIIGGDSSAQLTEDLDPDSDGLLEISGVLTNADPDVGESGFQAGSVGGIYGDLSIDSVGNWSYAASNTQSVIQQLDVGQSISDVLTVTTLDGTSQNIIITINGAEDAPEIIADTSGSVAEDGSLIASGILAISDTDTADNPVSFEDQPSIPGDNGFGNFELTSGSWSYTLNNNHTSVQALDVGETLTDTRTFTATDGSSRVVTITINGAEDNAVITGTTTATVAEDSLATPSWTLAISDTDTSDNPVSFADQDSTLGDNGYGNFSMSGSSWSYSLNNAHAAVQALAVGETLDDTHTFYSTRGTPLLVSIIISGTEDLPTVEYAMADQTAVQDSSFNYIFASIVFDDIDASDTLSYTATLVDDSPLPGWLSFDGTTRSFSGTPANADVGSLSVKVIASDGIGTVSDNFTLTVKNIDDAPVIGGNTSAALTEDIDPDSDNLLEISGLLTIADPDVGESSFLAGTVGGSYGDLIIDTAGNWSYSAENTQAAIQRLDDGESIDDILTVTTADGTAQTITITLNGTEDAPVITAITTGTVAEDGTLTASGTLAITDTDRSDNPISFPDVASILGDNGFGHFVLTGGTWTYTLDNGDTSVQALDTDESLTDSHAFTASDGSTQGVTITIRGSDDAAVISGTTTGSVAEDGALTSSGDLTIIDTDTSDPSSFVDVAAQAADNGYGTFEITGDTWIYRLDNSHSAVQALDVGETLTDTYTFTAPDGVTQLVTVTIDGGEDTPVFTSSAVTTASEDSAYSYSITTREVDVEAVSISASTLPAWLTLTDNGDGTASLSGTPTNAEVGDHSVVLVVSDGSVSSQQSFTLAVANTDDAPTFEEPSFVEHTITTAADGAIFVTTEDVDGDGDLDVLSASYNDNTIAWYENDGTENFTAQTITLDAASARSVTTADVDGDGDLDVLSASLSDDKIAWYENDGSENFTAHTITTTADGANSVTTADVDGDGDLDVLSASYNDHTIAWYENDGSENFTAHTITNAANNAYSVTTADVDGDGDLDVLSASFNDKKIAWYENDGSENFTAHTITTAANGAFAVTTADMDGDGDLDVLSASSSDDKIAWYENDGSENFIAHTITTAANGARSVTTADVDGDGDLDVLSASQSDDKIAWYENDGSENFTAHTITTAANGARSVTTADVDGDGDLDVLSASQDDDKIAWYENIPVTSLDGNPTYVEGGAAVVLDANVTIFDEELSANNNFDGATLTLARNGGDNSQDVISLADLDLLTKNGQVIAVVSSSTPGSYAFTFTDANGEVPTQDDVNALMQQITYRNTSDTPPASVQIDWTFNDGNTGFQGTGGPLQVTGSTTVDITAVDDPATITGDISFNGDEGDSVGGDLDATDVEGLTDNTYFSVTTPSDHGTATIDGITGAWTFTPTDLDWFGSDTFTVTVTDDLGGTTTQVVSITLANVNDAAVITGTDTGSVQEDVAVVADNISTSGTLNIVDPDTGESSFQTGTINGSYGDLVMQTNGNWSYTADNTQAAIQQLDLGESLTDTLTVSAFDSTTHNVIITINGSDDAAVISGTTTGTVQEDGTLTSSAALAITDTDSSDPTDFVDVASTAGDNGYGSFAMTGNTWTYSLDNANASVQALDVGETLIDTFTFSAPDGVTQQVSVTINGALDTPTIESTIADQSLAEDFSSYTIDLNSAFTDVETTDNDLVYGVSGNTNINVSISSGIATITPSADWNGSETLTFSATDAGTPGLSVSQDVVFAVSAVADIADDSAVTVVEDTATVIVVLANDSFEGTPTVTAVSSPRHGAVVINGDNTLTYTPAGNYTGADGFTYTVTSGGVTETATVNLAVTSVTDLYATNDSFSTNEDTVLNADVATNDSTSSGGSLSYAVDTDVSNGTLVLNANGSFTYTPDSNYNGSDSFTYTVTDADSGESSTQTVSLTIDPVTDLSTADDSFSTDEDVVLSESVAPNDSTTSGGSLSYAVDTDVSNGTLVLNSNGSFTYTSNSNYTGNDSFTYTITDADSGESSTQTVSLTIDPVTDLSATNDSFSTNEDTVLNADVATNDSTSSGGSLSYAVDTDVSNGTLVLNANGSFTYTPDSNYNGSDSFTYTVTDADSGESSTQTVSLTIDPVTDLSAADDSFITDEDVVLSESVAPNDSTTSGGSLSYAVNTDVSNGNLVLNSNGSFTYTSNSNYTGSDSFTYTITDADSGESSTQTVSLTIDPVTDLLATNDSFSTNEDTVLNADVATNDSTSSGGSLSYAVDTDVSNGTLVLNANGSFTYTPDSNYNGSDSFTYTVTDADSGESSTQTVSLTIDPVTDLSTADDSFSTDEDVALSDSVATNDSTTSGGSLSYAVDTDVSNGTLVLNSNGSFTYTTNSNYTGSDSFTYTITDADSGESSTQTVSLTIDPVTDLSATNDSFSTDEDIALSDSVATNDSTTSGGSLSYAVDTDVSSGTLVLNANGSFTYTPDSNYNGSDSFTYTVTDADSGESSTQAVSLTIDPVTDLSAVDDSFSTDEDVALSDSVATNDSTSSGGSLIYAVDTDVSNGTLVLNSNGSFTYTSNSNYTGSDSFTYTVTDADSGESSTQIVSLTIDPVTDLSAADDSFSTDEDVALSESVAPNDSTTSSGSLSYAVDTDVSNGTLVLNRNGSFTYTSNSNYTGSDSFTYTVTDAVSGESDTRSVDLTIDPVTDLSAADDSFSTDEDVALYDTVATNDSTTSGGSLSYAVDNDVSNGTLVLNANGSFTYTPDANFNGSDSFTYTVTDAASDESDTRSVDLTIDSVTDLSAANDSFSTDEDVALSESVATNDSTSSGGNLIYAVDTDVSNGTLVLNSNGSFTYTSNSNYTGSDRFTYIVTDADSVESSTQTVSLTVDPVTDLSAADDSFSTDEDVALSESVATNDSTSSGGNLNYAVDTDVSYGTLVLNSNGSFTYTSNSNYTGSDSFTYTVTDTDSGESSTQTVSLTIDPVTDLSATNNSFSTDEDVVLSDSVATNDSTSSGGSLSYAVDTDVSNGTLVLNANGSFTYTPDSNHNGSDSFSYTVTDADSGESSTQSVSLTVDQVTDLSAADDSFNTDEDVALSDSVATNDSTSSGGSLSYAVNTDVSKGTLVLNVNGSFTYTPESNYTGSDSFTYTVTDAASGESDTRSVDLTINSVTDLSAADDSFSTDEDVALSDSVATNDSTSTGGSLNYAVDTDVRNGTLVLSEDGTFIYTPESNFNGEDGFSYMVTDTASGESIKCEVVITVMPIDDSPQIIGTTTGRVSEDGTQTFSGTLSIHDADADDNPVSFSNISMTRGDNGLGDFSLDGENWTYTLDNEQSVVQSLDQGESLIDTHTFVASNGVSQTITITISGYEDAPSAAAVDLGSMDEGSFIVITQSDLLDGSVDVDGDELSARNLSLEDSSGTLIDNGDGTWTYTPIVGSHGSVRFSFEVDDGSTSSTTTATLQVDAIDDMPFFEFDFTGSYDSQVDSGYSEIESPLSINDSVESVEEVSEDNEISELAETEQDESVLDELIEGKAPDEDASQANGITDDGEISLGQAAMTGTMTDFTPMNGSLLASAVADFYKGHDSYEYQDVAYKPVLPKSIDLRHLEITPFEIDPQGPLHLSSIMDNDSFVEDLESMRRDIDKAMVDDRSRFQLGEETAIGVTMSLSAGIVSWVLRTGSLMASFMSVVPLWKQLDPLPILGAAMVKKSRINSGKKSEEDESVEALFKKNSG